MTYAIEYLLRPAYILYSNPEYAKEIMTGGQYERAERGFGQQHIGNRTPPFH